MSPLPKIARNTLCADSKCERDVVRGSRYWRINGSITRIFSGGRIGTKYSNVSRKYNASALAEGC